VTESTAALLASLLRGTLVPWSAVAMTPAAFLQLCEDEELGPLIDRRLRDSAFREAWPDEIRNALADAVTLCAAQELLRCAETRRVLDALAAGGIEPMVFKGTALAYSIYPSPEMRPRSDTDLLIPVDVVKTARAVMTACGYRTTAHCSELFQQFDVQMEDRFGVRHAFDLHWGISTQPAFAGLLSYDEMRSHAHPIAALGPAARGAGTLDALLLACVHPVMHHRNIERLLWLNDIHLLASTLAPSDFESFCALARHKRMAAVCRHSLGRARAMLGTAVPDFVFDELFTDEAEASAEYLKPNRRWRHELASSVRGAGTQQARIRLLRQVLFPTAQYMRGAYGLDEGIAGTLMLPAVYVHRNLFGAWKLLSGRK
jgi:hypothetical protein